MEEGHKFNGEFEEELRALEKQKIDSEQARYMSGASSGKTLMTWRRPLSFSLQSQASAVTSSCLQQYFCHEYILSNAITGSMELLS